jgi:hypothetical protein
MFGSFRSDADGECRSEAVSRLQGSVRALEQFLGNSVQFGSALWLSGKLYHVNFARRFLGISQAVGKLTRLRLCPFLPHVSQLSDELFACVHDATEDGVCASPRQVVRSKPPRSGHRTFSRYRNEADES